jgi:SpoIID/LytB domain protein
MRPVRFLPMLLALVAGLLAPAPAHSAVEVPATFTFSGAGWGHGVGMSQYGALGMAREGSSELDILQHYYPTTSIQPVRDDMDIRVNLLYQVPSAVIRVSGTPDSVMQVLPGDLKDPNLPSVATFGFTQTLNLAVDGGNVLASISAKDVTTRLDPAPVMTIRWSGTRYLDGADAWARVGSNASAPLYRYGQIVVRVVKTATGTALNVTNDVRIHDEYLRGIAEMPSSWPSAALRSQVIAARSYALSRYGTGKLTSACGCHVYDSVKDQRFAGWAKEAEANWGARWAGAVAETSPDPLSGLAVVSGGKPITAYFFSSSGGRTQNVSEVWGSTIPWLVSVPDPWSVDPAINPTYAAWTRTVTQAVMAKAFGLDDVVSVSFPLRTAGGGIKSAVGTSTTGKTVPLSGETFRSRTQLPSTYLMRAIGRIDGKSPAAIAVAVAKVVAPQATTAVLSDDGDSDLGSAVAAVGWAAAKGIPHLLLDGGVLPKATSDELRRRKITSVTIVGPKPSAALATALKGLGIKATRVSASSALAGVNAARSGEPILASLLDPDVVALAAGAAAKAQRPLILVGPLGLTARELALLPEGSPVTVIGRRISLPRVDMEALELTHVVTDLRVGEGENAVAIAAAALDDEGIRVLLVSSASDAIAAAALQQPMLWVRSDATIPDATTAWLKDRPRLVQMSLIGSLIPNEVVAALRALG